jgi:hypothetical protein
MKRIISETGGSSTPQAVVKAKTPRVEHTNRHGAMKLAKRLERYWHERGYYSARFWAESVDERFEKIGTHELYRMVCNLIDGMPPTYQTYLE